ncbi:MAG: hypothetical protein MJ252_07580 [archaeon]|nr:hypothetical protein [archaeon]
MEGNIKEESMEEEGNNNIIKEDNPKAFNERNISVEERKEEINSDKPTKQLIVSISESTPSNQLELNSNNSNKTPDNKINSLIKSDNNETVNSKMITASKECSGIKDNI